MRYLCRWALKRVVVENDALQVSEITVAHGNRRHLVTGEIKPYQWKLGQLCKANNIDMTQTSRRKYHQFRSGAGVRAFLTWRKANEVVPANVEVTQSLQLTDLRRKCLDLITADIL